MRDEFEFDLGGVIDAHAESNRGDDESFAEARQRVSRGYRSDRFLDEPEELFGFDEEY